MKPWNLNGSKVFSCPFGERYPLPYPLAAKRPFYVPFHPVRAVSLHLLRYMTVYVQGKGRRCVAQVALDGFCIVPVLERQHRVGVAEVMHSGVWCVNAHSQPFVELITSTLSL